MIDSKMLGETAARCMEYMDDSEDLDEGEVLAVAIVVIAQNKGGDMTMNRTFCSDTTYYRQLGILEVGLECVKDGYRHAAPDETDDDDE